MCINRKPADLAKEIADRLRSDPVAASLVHEFIPGHDLLDLLDLRRAMSEVIAEAVETATQDRENDLIELREKLREARKEISDLNWKLSPTQ